MSRTRRVVALAAGLVLSTLLLGGGWLGSTWRERQTRLRESRARLARVADVVRGAVDESLEELRTREDERPFYLYAYYYSPPEVLAISDPIAVSPLAHPPSDLRIIGHFQIDPGGAVRTPYTADPEGPPHALSTRVRSIVVSDTLAPLRQLTSDLEPRPPPEPARPAAGRSSLLTLSVGDSRPVRASASAPPPSSAPPSQLDLNTWGNAQAADLNLAQRGDPLASARVQERGRQMPNYNRRNVTWEQAEAQQQSQAMRQQQSPSLPRRPTTPQVRARLDRYRVDVAACAPGVDVITRLRIRGADGRAVRVAVSGVEDEAAERCVRDTLSRVRFEPFLAETLVIGYGFAPARPSEPELADATGLDNMVQRETEVDYTPMAFRRLGDQLVLHRLVTHEGVAVVQGVLMNRAHLSGAWIPSIVARHASHDATPTVVSAGAGECVLRRPASDIIDSVELCFAPSALSVSTADLDAELGWQLAALAALLAISLFAAFAIVASARHAEALSRQKSAFVSAVSHELRTPLTTLRMHAEMLEGGLVTQARQPKVHRELVRESVRLARLVDNVLSLSKLEEGRRRLERTDGDLRAHVREVVEGQRALVEERGFELIGPTSGDPIEACFDRQAVEQIVVNLIENAVKYGAGGADTIEVLVEPPATIRVLDRGPGIPKAERRRVFERFHRVERPEHAHAPGTGIGLALVAELAAAHGGQASVHPREGGGLEARVRLSAETRG